MIATVEQHRSRDHARWYGRQWWERGQWLGGWRERGLGWCWWWDEGRRFDAAAAAVAAQLGEESAGDATSAPPGCTGVTVAFV
eukprot:3411944-Prymnesium_polylepis.1